MIITVKGDLLKGVKSGHIVHGCNAQGIMGGGIALQIKKQLPFVYDEYQTQILADINPSYTKLGRVISVPVGKHIIMHNAITQDFFGTEKRHLNYEALAVCLEKIQVEIDRQNVDKVLHFPLIGCGLAGGNWKIVSNMIDTIITTEQKYLWMID